MYASLAGALGSSITFVSLQAPRHRVTEVIGMLESSGFLGMAVGPIIGDMIYAQGTVGFRGHSIYLEGSPIDVDCGRIWNRLLGRPSRNVGAAGRPPHTPTPTQLPSFASISPAFCLWFPQAWVGDWPLQVFVRPLQDTSASNICVSFF